MWCIVEFHGIRKEVAVVPVSWIPDGKNCYWPPFGRNSAKLDEAVRSSITPQSSWNVYEAHIVASRIFETYEVAASKVDVALKGSELSGEEINRNSTLVEGTDSGSDEDNTEESIKTPRRMRKSAKKSKLFTANQAVNLPAPPVIPSQSYVPNSGFDQREAPTLVSVTDLLRSNSIIDAGPVATVSYSTPSGTTSTNAATAAALTTILYDIDVASQLKDLRTGQDLLTAKVDMAIDMLRTVLASKPNTAVSGGSKVRLPLTDLKSFWDLDSRIRESSGLRDDLISMLSNKGGTNANQITYRILATLLTDELMTNFTFGGQKASKDSFKQTMFVQCICDAVRRHAKGSVATDKEIEKAIEYWLKRANVRILRKKAKKNRKRDQSVHGNPQNQDESDEPDFIPQTDSE